MVGIYLCEFVKMIIFECKIKKYMDTSRDKLGSLIHDTFVASLMKVRTLNMLLSDMYVCMSESDEATLVIYDDSDNVLHSEVIPQWDEFLAERGEEEARREFVELIKEALVEEDLNELFNEMEYNGPFSLLLVDEEMNLIEELLTVDHENIMISDEFWEKMDRELDEFFDRLMSDTNVR